MNARKHSLVRLGIVLVVFAALALGPSLGAPRSLPLGLGAQPAIAQTTNTPTVLVPGGVTSYSLAGPKLWWHSAAYCPSPLAPPAGPGVASPNTPQAANDPEVMSRVATVGSATRQVFNRNGPRAAGVCNPYHVRSNIVADDQYVYWVDDTGLVRLSTNANVGDTPELMVGPIPSSTALQLAIAPDRIFVLINGGSSTSADLGFVYKSIKALFTIYGVGQYAGSLSVEGNYAYLVTNGALHRLTPGTTDPTLTLATGVTGYYAEGARLSCTISGCTSTDYVFIGKSQQVVRYNNRTNSTPSLIYTSSDNTARVYTLTGDGTNVFLFERRSFNCGQLFCQYNDVLLRTSRGNGTGTVLYANPSGTSPGPAYLTTDGTFLFWQLLSEAKVLRLPNNAEALAQTNLRVTDIEVTQGVQKLDNSVLLIKNRRTFVRVHVKSDGPTVEGIAGLLYGSWDEGGGGPLEPLNRSLLIGLNGRPVGPTRLPVQPTPNRLNLNDSFLFELPWSWTRQPNLRLTAVLNPYHFPLQQSYANNTKTVGPLTFKDSPRLEVEFLAFGYSLGGKTYYPRMKEDVQGNYSWIRRVYPLSSSPGGINDPGAGLRPNVRFLFLNDLGTHVDQTHPDCAALITYNDKGAVIKDDRNLCASGYTNSINFWLRLFLGIDPDVFVYGMIPDVTIFPRGQAGGGKISSGPAADDWLGYYAGHEIGHTLSLGHPLTGDKECNLDGSDALPVYPHAHIGPNDESVAGFDPGDPALGVPRAVLGANTAGNTYFDMMAYCQPEWVSDTNYQRLYDNMVAANNSSTGLRPASVGPLQGDWLGVFGALADDGSTAVLHRVSHLDSVASLPAREPGPFSIQLLNAQGTVLADYPFTPAPSDDGPLSGFGEVVPFVAGSAQVRITRVADGQVLTTKAISATPPTISSVALENTTEPVNGPATVAWNASDADGNPLTFDVLYSRDGGTTFQALQMNVAANSVEIDTSRLGGGSTILRVLASDGVNTAFADSAPFTVATKPPVPRIIDPLDGTHIHYGELVNLSGEAEDFQDGGVADASLVWTDARGQTLGSGALLSLDNLLIGPNQITLTATNSAGVTASTSVTIFVDDDLNPPGPTLAVDPARVNWQVAAGETAAQTAPLAISNSGSGTLAWSATSDAAWLTLSAPSGSAPATLTLSGDPSGMAAGSTRSAEVVITSSIPGQPTQTITVPVTLVAGSVFDPPPQLPPPTATPVPTSTVPPSSTPTPTTGTTMQRKVYLPLVQR